MTTPAGRKALTRLAAPTYHEEMHSRMAIRISALVLAVAAGMGAGCEEAAKKSVRVQPPASSKQAAAYANTASASAAPQTAINLPSLPLHPAGTRPAPILNYPSRDARKAELVAQVEQKFASGQTNYKAGHLEAARKDFDDAVDALLQSGYDLDADPKLSELFHRVVDTVYTYELQAFRAGDGFQEAPAVPAPIDEVAEMTFPVDPRLKERAEESAKNISHD